MEELIRFGVSFPEGLLKSFDGCIGRMGYGSRSEALRDLTRDLIQEQELSLRGGGTEVIGTVTFSYDHSAGDVKQNLMDIQHASVREIVSTTHIHMDHDLCLEVLIVRGDYGRVKALSDRISALKGVKQGRLVVVEIGGGGGPIPGRGHHHRHPHPHRPPAGAGSPREGRP